MSYSDFIGNNRNWQMTPVDVKFINICTCTTHIKAILGHKLFVTQIPNNNITIIENTHIL